MMLTSIFSSDLSVVVNSVFRKGKPVDRHRGDNQATVIIIQWQEWKPCDFRCMFRLHSSTREHAVNLRLGVIIFLLFLSLGLRR